MNKNFSNKHLFEENFEQKNANEVHKSECMQEIVTLISFSTFM